MGKILLVCEISAEVANNNSMRYNLCPQGYSIDDYDGKFFIYRVSDTGTRRFLKCVKTFRSAITFISEEI